MSTDDLKDFTQSAPTLTFDSPEIQVEPTVEDRAAMAQAAIKEMTATAPSMPMPNLTLNPGQEEQATAMAQTAVNAGDKPIEVIDDSMLTDEERKMVDDFSNQIQLNNSSMVLEYGAGAQKKMADFSSTALNNVKTKDLGEVGDMLSSVVTELKSFDAEEEEKGFLGFFKKTSNKLTAMRAKYDHAEENVNKITTALEDHQVTMMKDVAMLDKMYEMNKVYFKELTMYIIAGKKKLNKVRTEELPLLTEKAQKSGLAEDAQAAKDLDAMCNRFEKKLYDLELTRMVSIQMAPQIRLIQNNDTMMIEKIQSTIVNTIPLWKSQMVLAMGVHHASEAAKAQNEVNTMTNELLKKNAATLKMATVETAKASEKGIIDIETLKTTNQSLISTLDDVMKIQEEGRTKRLAAESELAQIEAELKNKLLEIRK